MAVRKTFCAHLSQKTRKDELLTPNVLTMPEPTVLLNPGRDKVTTSPMPKGVSAVKLRYMLVGDVIFGGSKDKEDVKKSVRGISQQKEMCAVSLRV